MKKFWKLALISAVLTYLLIFIGGLVRVSGAGLGCPDWPKCFGRWIPPTSVSQLPAGFDPSLFNFTLAWIEYINRIFGMITGLFIAATAIWALTRFRKYPKIVIASVASALLVAYQGWQGSVVVGSALAQYTITLHLINALIIFAILLYAAQASFYIANNYRPINEHRKQRQFTLILILLTSVQIILGTQIRSEIKLMRESNPVTNITVLFDKMGPTIDLHIFMGFFLALAFAAFAWYIRGKLSHGTSVSTIVFIASFLQIGVGLLMATISFQPIFQVLHLWISTFIFGGLIFIFVALKQRPYNEKV